MTIIRDEAAVGKGRSQVNDKLLDYLSAVVPQCQSADSELRASTDSTRTIEWCHSGRLRI